MKKLRLLFVLTLCLIFSACGSNTDTPSSESQAPESSSTLEVTSQSEEPSPAPEYFESDAVVDKFFTDYNSIAEIKIPAEEIEKGNIRTKALVYIDDLSLEVINANDFLSISMGCSPENESTTLYALFRDCIKTMRPDISDEDIQSTWDSIHESGYLMDGYEFNDIKITYIPSKELSYGMSNLRIDLNIPLN